MVGLLLIALGTGGIKPCVSAFGGDQFGPHQVQEFYNICDLLQLNHVTYCMFIIAIAAQLL
jgi:dipeptide/tripeptide permease